MTLNTEHASPADLQLLREEFGDGGPEDALGWEAVHAFEARHGVVLPEPYRTFVAEITDGTSLGPTDYDGILPIGDLPADWPDALAERDLSIPFPLTERWIWEEDEEEPDTDAVFLNGSIVLGTDGCGMNWHLIVTGQHRVTSGSSAARAPLPSAPNSAAPRDSQAAPAGFVTGPKASRGATSSRMGPDKDPPGAERLEARRHRRLFRPGGL